MTPLPYFNKYKKEDYELYGTELFRLCFYGINIFFTVEDVEEDYITISEVDTIEEECYDTPLWDKKSQGYKIRESNLYVLPNNDYKIVPGIYEDQLVLQINVLPGSLAISKAKYYSPVPPKPGQYLALKIADSYQEDYERTLNTKYIKTTYGDFPA